MIREGQGLGNWIIQDAVIRRRIRSGWANGIEAVAPYLLELRRRNISTVISCNSGPKLLTAGFVDGVEAVGVNNPWLISDLSIDAQPVAGLR